MAENSCISIIESAKFGKVMYYPNCRRSKLFCELIECETLRERHLVIIKNMGVDVKISKGKITIVAED